MDNTLEKDTSYEGMPLTEVVERLKTNIMPGDPYKIINWVAEAIKTGSITWEQLGTTQQEFVAKTREDVKAYHGKDIRGDEFPKTEELEALFTK